MSRPKLILLKGLPASGKSTVGDGLIGYFPGGGHHVDVDRTKHTINPYPEKLSTEELIAISKRAHDTSVEKARRYLERGSTVVISEGFRFRPFYDRVCRIAGEYGAELHSVHLGVPMEMAVERDAHRGGINVGVRKFERYAGQDAIYRGDIVVDNSRSLDDALAIIREEIDL